MNVESNAQTSRLQRLQEFLGLKQSIVAVLVMVILVGMGEKLGDRFVPKYLEDLGGNVLGLAFLAFLNNFLTAVYSVLGGYVSDRLGYKRALMVFNIVAILGFLIVALFPFWQAVIIGSMFFLSWNSVSLPATMDLVSKVLPKQKRTMGVSLHSLVRRIPMALGPVIGGYLIAAWGMKTGMRLAFIGAILLSIVSLIMQQFLIETPEEKPAPKEESHPFRMLARMSPGLKNLLVADILIRFCEQIPLVFISIWVMGNLLYSSEVVGWLSAVEMVTAALVYIPVAWLADKGQKKKYVVMTFVFFTLFPLVFWLSRSILVLVIAFLIRGLKEFGEPTRKALIMDLAPEGQKAAMFGAYYLFRDLVVAFGAFGGVLLWAISPAVCFLAAFGFGVVGTVYFAVWGKDLSERT